MKISFRIGPEQQGGEQSPRQADRPVTPPSPWSPRCPASSVIPRTESPADHSLRRGTACCARCSVSHQRHSLAISRSMPAFASCLRFQVPPAGSATACEPSYTPQSLPTTKNSHENMQVSAISNRFWPKNRSYRKQKTKPCLTGSRIARCEVPFLRDFCASFAPAKLHQERPPVAWRTTQS